MSLTNEELITELEARRKYIEEIVKQEVYFFGKNQDEFNRYMGRIEELNFVLFKLGEEQKK